jgi:N-dimethylarginine dimethylaminohydrolase
MSDVPPKPPLPEVMARHIEALQQEIRAGSFDVRNMPGYVPGEPPSVETWHRMDYLDIYARIWGRECGANGIGKLREVALTEISGDEHSSAGDEERRDWSSAGSSDRAADRPRMREQSLEYQAALEATGVLVHRVEFPDRPAGAYGPMPRTWITNDALIVRGGSITGKTAIDPFGFGRGEYLAFWAFTQLGITPIAAIAGRGVAEAGACCWLAEDVFVAARGFAFNDEGLEQLLPVVRRSSGLNANEFEALIIECSSSEDLDRDSGVSHRPDMVLGPLDVEKVIAYPPGLDFGTWQWLKARGYSIVEVERDEQVRWVPCNLTILEPGRVVMPAEAAGAVAEVRKLGVDVIEVPYSGFAESGGGLHSSTLEVVRDKGPYSSDR